MPPPKDPVKYELWRQRNSESHKGQNLGGTMPPRSEEWYRKQRESHLGHKCSDATRQKMSAVRKGVPKSKQHREKIGKGNGKERSGHWKGGTTKLFNLIRTDSRMLEWKRKVFERDNYTCRVSGKRGCPLEAHHIVEFSILLRKYNITTIEEARACEELWDIANGLTVTKVIHRTHHSRCGVKIIKGDLL